MMIDAGNNRIRIFSKKLPSGNCQVKFYVNSEEGQPYYGYMLVESGIKVSDVISTLHTKIKEIDSPDTYYHSHLFNLGKKTAQDTNFIVYRQ